MNDKDRAIAYAKEFKGSFSFMLDIQKQVRKGKDLTPKQVEAVLRCAAPKNKKKKSQARYDAELQDRRIRSRKYARPAKTDWALRKRLEERDALERKAQGITVSKFTHPKPVNELDERKKRDQQERARRWARGS